MARKELKPGRTGSRLHLDRETIRQLDDGGLDQVAGGAKLVGYTWFEYTCLNCASHECPKTTWQSVTCPWSITC